LAIEADKFLLLPREAWSLSTKPLLLRVPLLLVHNTSAPIFVLTSILWVESIIEVLDGYRH